MSRPLSFARSRSRNRSANRLIVLSLASVALMVLDGRYCRRAADESLSVGQPQTLAVAGDKPVELYEYGSTFMHTQQSLIAANRDLSAQNLRLAVMLRQSARAARAGRAQTAQRPENRSPWAAARRRKSSPTAKTRSPTSCC